METLVYKLPFKMKMQTLLENNKAYGERTKEDIARLDLEAQQEIEANFPTYYDEFQKGLFSGTFTSKDNDLMVKPRKYEIQLETILKDILSIREVNDKYKHSFVKQRLEIIEEMYKGASLQQSYSDRDHEWMHDAKNHLRDLIQSN